MATRKRTISKFTLAFATACLLTITSAPGLSQNAEQLYQQGIATYKSGDWSEAESIFRQVIKIDPSNADAYNNLGIVLSNQGKLEDAIANFKKAIQLKPNVAIAYYNLGLTQYYQGKLEDAIANFEEAIQLNPNYAKAYNNLGNTQYKQGKLEEAIANFEKAIQLNPNDPGAYNNLGMALADQGQLDEAIANFKKAIQLKPNVAIAYYNLGLTQYYQGKLEEAIANFEKAIQIDPNYATAYNNLGNALSDQGKLEEAISNYEKAIRLNPNDAIAYNNLGMALQQQGELEEAIKQYRLSLEIDSDFVIAQNNLKEAERLLALKLKPPLPVIDDTQLLPSATDELLVNALRSTARIIAQVSAEGISIGAGWVVKKEGNTLWIVTNRHVISDSKTDILSQKIEVEFFSELPDTERPRYTATIVNSTDADDLELDLAVLQITGVPDDIQKLEMRPGRVPRDATVRIIGHPYNIEDPWIASRGEILNYNPNNPQISMSGLFAQGNSGGPVINSSNQVIGMMVGIRSNVDVAVNPNQATRNLIANQPATGGIGLAYRIDIVIAKLREWGIID